MLTALELCIEHFMSSELDGIEQLISMILIGCAALDYIRVTQYLFLCSLCSSSEKDKIANSQWFEATQAQYSSLFWTTLQLPTYRCAQLPVFHLRSLLTKATPSSSLV